MNKVQRIKQGAYRTPEAREMQGDKYINWGVDNGYPDYLISLFDRSASHGGIVKGKVDYIVGRGVINQDGNSPKWKPNRFMDATELLRRLALDLELFGGIAIQVIRRVDGRGVSEVYHVPFHYFRWSKTKDKLYYSERWKSKPNKYKSFEPYQFDSTEPTSIIYETIYTPGNTAYPKPEYAQGITAIDTDARIANYHLNNIVNGFSGGTLVSFNNGIPSDPEQDVIFSQLKAQHSGDENAGDIVIVFSDSTDRAPTILDLKGNDLDKKFDQLKQSTKEEIFIAHRVVSPMIFGVRTAGQLGGRTEILEAYEMFKRTYIEPRQSKLLSTLQYLCMIMGYSDVLEILALTPISQDIPISESTVAQNLTKDEIRTLISDKYGLDLKPINQPTIQCKHGAHDDTDIKLLAAFEKLGVPFEDYEILDEVDVDIASKQIKVNQAELSDDEKKVLSFIRNNPKATAVSISDALNIDLDTVVKATETFSNKGFIRPSDAGFETTTRGETVADANDSGVEILTLYRYAWAQGFSDADATTSREFCKTMLASNKLYSRNDIDSIENDLGTDVWATRGGWYHNTDMDVNLPYCRHVWKQVIVTKKK